MTEEDKVLNFWELADRSENKQLRGETPGEFLTRINDPTKWIYGSELRDNIFLTAPYMYPSLAHLSRKAFLHYAGDRYNPHEISYEDELLMRCTIGKFIAYKVENRVKYDWEFIEHALMQVVSHTLDIDLPFSQERIDQGFSPEFRGSFYGVGTDVSN